MDLLYHGQFVKKLLNDSAGNSIFSPNNSFSLFNTVREGSDDSIMELFYCNDEKCAKSFDLYDHKLKKQSKLFTRPEGILSSDTKNNFVNKFGCDVEEIDVKNLDYVNSMRKWVSVCTKDSTKGFLEAPNLTNIINLNMAWNKNVGRGINRKTFHRKDQKSFEVEFVDFVGEFGYVDSKELKAKIVELPLDNGELKVVFILPNERDGILVLNEMFPYYLGQAFANLKKCCTKTSIPKFKLNHEFDLGKFLYRQPYNFCNSYQTGAIKTLTSLEVSS